MQKPDYDGTDYRVDTSIKHQGPLHNRRCTDVLFTLIFLAFAGVMVYIGLESQKNGVPEKILNPVDEDGGICGFQERIDYPYLYYVIIPELPSDAKLPVVSNQRRLADINYRLDAMCVKECPQEETSNLDCYSTKSTSDAICKTKFNEQTLTGHVGYGSDTLYKFCFPNINKLPTEVDITKEYNEVIGNFGLDDIQAFLQDLVDAKMVYLYCLGTCLGVAIVYSILLRFFAKPIIWLSIIGTAGGLCALSLYLMQYYNKYYGPDAEIKYSESMGKVVKGGYVVSWAIFAIFVCSVLCSIRNIKVSVAVLQTSAVVLIRNIHTLLVPFFALVFIVTYIGAWLYGLGYLLSCANVNQPTDGSQFKYINLNGKDALKWQIGIYVFGLFWVVELLQSIFKFMLIVGVCTWYFTSKTDARGSFSIFRGLWWSIRYNFGSLALGSFILAIIWMIRIIFEYIEKKTKSMLGEN